eukprot:TRINITY_DN6177_c0_g1_i1.p1 TRINITY_DN6177_c0_g1~~TRINITY_DN6177_c0_g1_i1.p1  ORF type:complete len:411 (+),score=77.75 TRINITY_DN6177_c0_g1_i1:610-1842(+)
MGRAVLQVIQSKLLDMHLEQAVIPLDVNPGEPTVKVFFTPDYAKYDRLLLLIANPEDRIGPGQWARSVCINEGINQGSVLPYVARAKQMGIAVMVLNPIEKVKGNQTPEEHIMYMWEHFIARTSLNQIAAVANKKGGDALFSFIKSYPDTLDRFVSLAFVDSEFDLTTSAMGFRKRVAAKSRKWFHSRQPQGQPLIANLTPDTIFTMATGTDRTDRGIVLVTDLVFSFIGSMLKTVLRTVEINFADGFKINTTVTATSLPEFVAALAPVARVATLDAAAIKYWDASESCFITPKSLSEVPNPSRIQLQVNSPPPTAAASTTASAATVATATPATATATATAAADTEQSLCIVCMEAIKCVAFSPCGHVACCTKCAQSMRNCPVCRAAVVTVLKLNAMQKKTSDERGRGRK